MKMNVDPKIALNFIGCQVAWSACVLGGANDRALAAVGSRQPPRGPSGP